MCVLLVELFCIIDGFLFWPYFPQFMKTNISKISVPCVWIPPTKWRTVIKLGMKVLPLLLIPSVWHEFPVVKITIFTSFKLDSSNSGVLLCIYILSNWFFNIFSEWKMKIILSVFFWVFPRRLIMVCRRFGTLYLFHLQRLDVKYFTSSLWRWNK